MSYDPQLHHRRSIRLKGYDYSQSGFYYITLCVKNKDYLFGKIVDHQMILNDAGRMVERWYFELPNKYPDIKCGEHSIMPNHFHFIIENNGNGNPNIKEKTGTVRVGADLRVCPNMINDDCVFNEKGKHVGLPLRVCPPRMGNAAGFPNPEMDNSDLGEHVGSPLRNVIQWYKTMSTNEYIRGVKTMNWKRIDGKLWQINYWEHIIRDQISFDFISSYILDNPKNWDTDKLR